MKDLIGEIDKATIIPNIEISESQIQKVLEEGLPVLTVDFILQNLRFASNVPTEVRPLVSQDVINFPNVFSWNQFDFSCINYVPHEIKRFDHFVAIMEPRRHLSNPINKEIIKTKCWPLVELCLYRKALASCID